MKPPFKNYARHRRLANLAAALFFTLLAALLLLPILYTALTSLMGEAEIGRYYALAAEGITSAALHFIPDRISFKAYYDILLARPDYMMKFWNSLLLCVGILAGQLVVSCMGGFAFAKFNLPCRNLLFYLLIILMMLPVQVTLVSNFLVLDLFRLTDTWWALFLPFMFLPFGTFLMTQIFRGIPDEVLDAAMLDGASVRGLLVRIMVPAGKGGVISLALLSFIDAWNMVEQPMAYLRDSARYPLSVFLSSAVMDSIPVGFACGVLAMLPVLLLFLFFNQELVEGIEFSGLK